MRIHSLLLAGAALALLAACGAPADRFAAPRPVPPVQKVRVSYASVSLREVSLPAYAAAEEIPMLDASGRVTSASGTLWADDPVRGVTLDLVRALTNVTGARIASEPWPFASRPDVSVDVRFEELLASDAGRFTARGMYFVAPDDPGRTGRARSFEISQAFDPQLGFAAIAAARSAALGALASDIAARGLR